MSRQLLEEAKKVLQGEAVVKLDPVRKDGKYDNDIDNDGDSDNTDSYLKKRRGAISAAIAKSKNESVKPDLSEEDAQRVSNILKGVTEANDSNAIEAHGVKGMKSTPWRKTFKSQEHFQKWLDKNEGDVKVHGTRKVKQGVAEETEQINELGDTPAGKRALQSYVDKANAEVKAAWPPPDYFKVDKRIAKRNTGAGRATRRIHGFGVQSIARRKAIDAARAASMKEETEQVDEMQVANKYALKGPQPAKVPAYLRKGNARWKFPLTLDDLKRKDTMSNIENLRKMGEVDLDESDDLGPIRKKQKTVMVTHETSGKERVIVDTPENRKRNAEMGFHAKSDEMEKNEAISQQTAARVGELHPTASQVLKHIQPKFHHIYKPDLVKGVFTGSYQDRAAVLSAAERAGHDIKNESVDLEDVTEIIESRNAFTIELPETLSYQDYLKAAMQAEGIESLKELDDETVMPFLTFVEQMFVEGQEEFVISELTYSELQDKIYAHQKSGSKVTGIERKTMNGQPYAAYVVTDRTGMRRKYIYQGNVRRVQSLGQATKPNETNPLED